MKKKLKVIDGDKVTIYQGRDVDLDDDLAPEYDLANMELRANPYSERLRKQNKLTIKLDSDISGYFHNSREVNIFLRKQINLVKRVVNA